MTKTIASKDNIQHKIPPFHLAKTMTGKIENKFRFSMPATILTFFPPELAV